MYHSIPQSNEQSCQAGICDVLTSIYENSEVFLFKLKINGEISYNCCSNFFKIFGYPDNVEDVDILELIHPEDIEQFLDEVDFYKHNLVDNSSNLYRIKHNNGRWFWIFTNSRVQTKNSSFIAIKGLGIICAFCNCNVKNVRKRSKHDRIIEAKLNELSNREKEVFRLISNCNSDKDIAEVLNISIHTAKTHRKNIIHKVGLDNSKSLIKFAFVNMVM